MKYFFLVILLCFSWNVKSQTLRETQDWLKLKFETYGNFKNSDYSSKTEEFDFVNNIVTISDVRDFSTTTKSGAFVKGTRHSSSSFNMFAIKSFTVSDNGITIQTRGNQITTVITFTNLSNDAQALNNLFSNSNSKDSEIYIPIEFSKEENLKERLTKALNRLGSFIPQPKEAF